MRRVGSIGSRKSTLGMGNAVPEPNCDVVPLGSFLGPVPRHLLSAVATTTAS